MNWNMKMLERHLLNKNYSCGKSQRYKKTIQYFDMLFGFYITTSKRIIKMMK